MTLALAYNIAVLPSVPIYKSLWRNIKVSSKNVRISVKLIIYLLLFVVLWLITEAIAMNPNTIIMFGVSILSVMFIIKNMNLSRTDIFIGILLGAMTVSYSVMTGLVTVITYLGGISIFKNSNYKITLLKSKKRKDILKTVLLALFVGIGLGIINVYLGKFSNIIDLSFSFQWPLMALYAGVSEEIVFRFFFFAICVWITRDSILSRFEGFLCYLIIIIPHVLIHFDVTNLNLFAVIQMSIMFGLPFALMQRKWDLTSAIGAHALVDLIRFIVFGWK